MNPPKPSLVELSIESTGRQNLPDRIYAELKSRILSGLVKPGERLLEKSLSEDLEVSRTPLREALNRLSHDDLVIFRPNSGYSAAPLSSNGFGQLQDLRVIIEPKVASLAAIRATRDDIESLRRCAEMPAVEDGDDSTFINFCQANARFHLLLVRAARNTMMETIVMSALDQYQRPAYLGIGRVTDHEKASKCHLDIVDAVEARDPAKAEIVMGSHVIGGSERITRALVSRGL